MPPHVVSGGLSPGVYKKTGVIPGFLFSKGDKLQKQ